jgi:hypothetical protein
LTRTCCATAGCHGCSTRCGPHRRWGCSCARSPSATSANSTRSPPGCWPGCARPRHCSPAGDRLAYLDVDDTIRGTYGYAKQGAGRGYNGVNGLNALLATLSTPAAAPAILGARLRRGATASVRGAGKLVSGALATARRAGVTGQLVVRGDSAFYAHDIVAACQRAGAHYSLAVREFPSVVTAISHIPEQAWTPIRYRVRQHVAPLRARGVPVEYLVADDEGHGFENPENQIMLFHAIERHLAAHLGGRS